jgi:type I restriction enzyme M protein
MLLICADPKEAARYFVASERPEIEENEFNLNLPRYVDTFEPEQKIEIGVALQCVQKAEAASRDAVELLRTQLAKFVEVTS